MAGSPLALSPRPRILLPIVLLGVAVLAAVAPPATSLGVGFTAILLLVAARAELPSAMALTWGLTIIPLYINIPDFPFAIPVDLLIAPLLLWRVFVVRRRVPSFGRHVDQALAVMVLVGAAVSTAFATDPLRAAFNFVRFTFWLLYLPAAREVYREPQAVAPSAIALLLGLGAQVGLGIAQLVGGDTVTLGFLGSPLAGTFMNANAIASRLAAQDFNWVIFDRTFPSGLFLNAIVFGLCLTIGGLILWGLPRRLLPPGRGGLWQVGGSLSLLLALLSFKVTAWVAMLVGGVAWGLRRARNPVFWLRAGAIGAGVILVVLLPLYDLIAARLAEIAAGSLITRLFAWQVYWANIRYGGLIGVGLGQASELAPSLGTVAAGQQLEAQLAPENSYVGLIVEIGVPATIALCALLVRGGLAPGTRRTAWVFPALVAGLVGSVGVYGLTDEHILPLLTLSAGLASVAGDGQE